MSSTAAKLIERAKVRADMVNSKFVSDETWLQWISDGYMALYDLLVGSFEDYYIAPPATLVVGADGVGTLPADFYKLRGIDDSSGLPLKPFSWEERNQVRADSFIGSGFSIVRYRLFGQTKVYFMSKDSAAGSYTLWYVPAASEVSSTSTVIDGINGWEDYISIDAAIKALMKEESAIKDLENERDAIVNRIITMGKNRDVSTSGRIVDVRPRGSSRFTYDGGFE
jgi:hypothetical protein